MAVQAKGLVMGTPLPGVYRVALINLAIGLAIALISAVTLKGVSAGFLAGYMLGFMNLIWLFRIVRKGMTLAPEKAVGFVSRRYFARFIITAGIIFVMVSKGVFSTPWPALVGIAISILTSTGSLIFIAKEELK